MKTRAQWDVGAPVLGKLLQMLEAGREWEVEEAFNRLLPSDMVQTEHIFIVAAANHIGAVGEKLTLAILRREIAKNDPAGFVGIVLDGLLGAKLHDGFDLEGCIRQLVEARPLSP